MRKMILAQLTLLACAGFARAKEAPADFERKAPVSDADRAASKKVYEDALGIEKGGDVASAASQYAAAIKLDPENAACLNHYAWFLAVTAPEKMRDPAKALKLALQAAKATGEKNRDILDTVAEVYFRIGDHARAVEYGKKALADGLEGHSKQKYLEAQLKKFVDAAAEKAKAPVAPASK